MAGDTDGRWRRALENLGAVVGGYDPALRVYRANAGRGVIEGLAAADFVLAVEPIRLVEASHDTAVPAMGADALRAYDGAPGIYSGTGGVSVPIAVVVSHIGWLETRPNFPDCSTSDLRSVVDQCEKSRIVPPR